MAHTAVPTVAVDDFGKASWANDVAAADADLTTRVEDLETTVGAGSSVATLTDVALGSPLASGDVLTYNGAAWVNDQPAAVDLATADVTGRLPLANLVQGTALSVLGVTGNATANEAPIVAASDGQVLRRSGTSVGFGAVDLASANAITGDLPLSNLAQGTALSVLGVTGNATADEASIVAASDGQVLRRSGTAVGFGAVDLASANAITGALPLANLPTTLGQMLRVSVPLTNGQIIALPTTPVTVLATPGAGFFWMLVRAVVIVDATAGAYGNVNTTFSALFIESQFGPRVSMEITNDNTLTTPLTRLTGFLTTTNKRAVQLQPYAEAIEYFNAAGDWGYFQAAQPFNISDIEDAAWRIKIDNNGSGILSGGNASNTGKVVLYYTKEPV